MLDALGRLSMRLDEFLETATPDFLAWAARYFGAAADDASRLDALPVTADGDLDVARLRVLFEASQARRDRMDRAAAATDSKRTITPAKPREAAHVTRGAYRGIPRSWSGANKPITRGKSGYRPGETGAAAFEARNRVVEIRGFTTTLERVLTALAARRAEVAQRAAESAARRAKRSYTGTRHASGTYLAGRGSSAAARRRRKRKGK